MTYVLAKSRGVFFHRFFKKILGFYLIISVYHQAVCPNKNEDFLSMCSDGDKMNNFDTKRLFFILTRVMPKGMQHFFQILFLYMKLYYMLD